MVAQCKVDKDKKKNNDKGEKNEKNKMPLRPSVKVPKRILRTMLSQLKVSKCPRVKEAKLKPKKCAIYTRTSSKTNFAGSSSRRQVGAAVQALAQMTKSKVKQDDITVVSDCISGLLPVDRRTRLVDHIESKEFEAIFVESSRALARKASVTDDLAAMAEEHGVKLILADIPSLLTTDEPMERMVNRIQTAIWEFEWDIIYKRLMGGLVDKLRKEEMKPKATRNLTQHGETKVNGRKSTLQKLKPGSGVLKQLRVWELARAEGKFGWRVMQEKFRQKLQMDALPLESARRMAWELEAKI